ncbi:MAG: LysR family transcriptional regulator [Candidatus Melainabacteria bacterium]|nr:LysR family transcriptional regulator [Candidatus Melainabacteria bacterium]
MIELRQLRYFVRIAQLEHFGQAAQDLHVAQPALSRQMKQLEEELGVELFERLPRGVRLTAAGKVLLGKTTELLDDVERMVVATQQAASGKTGFLKIGFADGAMYSGHVPEILGLFRKKNPKVKMELVPASSLAQAELLDNGSIDIGFVYWLPNNTDAIDDHSINNERIVLAAAKSNRTVGRRKTLMLRDLQDAPFVWFKRSDGPLYYDLILSKCSKAGLTVDVVQETFTESAMLSLVSADIGVTFITEAARRRKPDNVTLIEIKDMDATITLRAMWRSDNRNPALKPFITAVKNCALD